MKLSRFVTDKDEATTTRAVEQLRAARRRAQGERLVHRFLLHWKAACAGEVRAERQLRPTEIILEREVVFHPVRKWRFDFAHVASKTAIELEGGVFSNGAHVRGAHFEEDCRKYNAAQAMGWRVFRLTERLICQAELKPIVAVMLRGKAEF